MTNNFIRSFYIIGLLLVSFFASSFMVLESGEFYQSFYPSTNFYQMGYIAAFLNEIFIAIMAGVWLPDLKKTNNKKVHPANYLFKAILLLLFATTVFSASFNVISPILKSIQKQRNIEDIENVLLTQVEDHKLSLSTFSKQNQRTNSAITTRNQIKTKAKLIEKLEQKKPLFNLYIEAIFLFLLRFGIQVANLCCVWLVGWTYRYNRVQNKQKPRVHLKKNNTNAQKDKPSTETPNKLPYSKAKQQSAPQNIRLQPTPISVSFETKQHQVPKHEAKDRSTDKASNFSDLQKRLVSLIESRHVGVSLSELFSSIGVNELEVKKVINPNRSIDETKILFLEQVINKIEQLHQNEMVVSA